MQQTVDLLKQALADIRKEREDAALQQRVRDMENRQQEWITKLGQPVWTAPRTDGRG